MTRTEDLLARRRRFLGPNVPTFYDEPVEIVRGQGVWLWDAEGRRYLDCYNNVPHVGHCHPQVVEAICRQAATLNTHTRYLHEAILTYAERLTAKFDHDLTTLMMVCTGSEANDVALRMGQAMTGKTGMIATDATYHGNTALVSQLSTRRPPIGGYAPNVRLMPAPDPIRHPDDGTAFAAHVTRAIDELQASGHGFASLILCPFFANEGFPALSPGFLDETVRVVRKAGGILIADEVQPGFGRLGSHWWGHQALGFAPDVVTIGKPMANGHPVAAVIARPDVMEAVRGAFGYFNPFGGNPVSCAAALATLDVIEAEGLVDNARDVGAHALARLRALTHPRIADVRGQGLFFGVEFTEPGTTIPATAFVLTLVEEMRRRGILLNKIGPGGGTLKIRPPMPFSRENADLLADTLAEALAGMPE